MAEPPTRTPRRDDDEEARHWAEEEAARADDEYKAQIAAEEAAADRESAIEAMTGWFDENFEDPQNRTPIDSEENSYIYISGGPFDASDVIGSQFAGEYDQEWIEAAVEQVQGAGTYEWAPTPNGHYYEAPDGDRDPTEERDGPEQRSPAVMHPVAAAAERAEIVTQVGGRLDEIESQLSVLWAAPPPTGHNQPPGEIGLPPYDGEEREELEQAIRVTREEIAREEPATERLERAESTFRKVSVAILKWLGRKADLAVDEGIKAGMAVAKWGTVAALAQGLAADIARLLSHVIPF